MLTALALLGISILVGCGELYSSESISAIVIDATTGLPIPEVNVVAYWGVTGGLEGGSYEGSINTVEATTDHSGAFVFPSWGPKWSGGTVRRRNPILILFKRGYAVRVASNNDQRMGQWSKRFWELSATMRSDWNNAKIELKAIDTTGAAYVEDLDFLSNRLKSIGESTKGPCDWEKLTRTIVSLEKEYRILKHLGMTKPGSNSVYEHLISNDSAVARQCSTSPIDLLRGAE